MKNFYNDPNFALQDMADECPILDDFDEDLVNSLVGLTGRRKKVSSLVKHSISPHEAAGRVLHNNTHYEAKVLGAKLSNGSSTSNTDGSITLHHWKECRNRRSG